MKIHFSSSENKDKFGISMVIRELQKRFTNNNQIKYSNKLGKFIISNLDILHIHGCWKIRLIFFFLLAKIKGLKIIISPHGMIDQNSLNKKKFRKIIALFLYQKLIFKNSDLIIVNSENEKKNLIKQISGLKNIKVIPHGVNYDKNFFPRKNLNKDLEFVFFSRIHESKNLLTLVKLWEKSFFLKKFNLNIFGEIEDKNYFLKIIKYINRNRNIKYLGFLNNNIQKQLSKYDVFIHPSKSENFGLVIYEALSSGLYLILNKSLKKKELKDNYFAKTINFNLLSLNKCVKEILKNQKNIKSFAYKKKCYNYIRSNFNWDTISENYLNQYIKLINKH